MGDERRRPASDFVTLPCGDLEQRRAIEAGSFEARTNAEKLHRSAERTSRGSALRKRIDDRLALRTFEQILELRADQIDVRPFGDLGGDAADEAKRRGLAFGFLPPPSLNANLATAGADGVHGPSVGVGWSIPIRVGPWRR